MQKVAAYRRAVWLIDDNHLLEDIIRSSLSNCPTVVSTKFEYKSNVDVQISSRSTNGEGIGCYFTLYAEGSPTATVENGGSGVHRRTAPDGEEFLKTGIYLIIQGNHVGYVANGHTNDGQITGLLHKFIESQGNANSMTQFALMARADRHEISRLLRTGVKFIDLGFSDFVTSSSDLNANHENYRTVSASRLERIQNGISKVKDGLGEILGPDRSREEIEAAADLQARIHLGYDGRNANELVPQILASIGEELNDGDDQFKIVTNTGVVITRDKIVVKKEVNVEGDEVALVPQSAFDAVRFAMQEWRTPGLFG